MKKLSLFIFVAAAILVAGGFASSRLFNASASSTEAVAKPACPDREFGHIRSLTQRGDNFELRFDPAWFLSGATASRAALEDTGSSDVPNDNYVVEEGHRALTYIVPATAHISVLTRGAALDRGTAITVAQLAQLVKGERPVELFESLESGVWIQFRIDTVCSLAQQYRP